MNVYVLYTVKSTTKGLDTQVNLRLEVSRTVAPTRLSDFAGGVAELYDGLSSSKSNYTISLTDYDNRRIELTSENGHKINLAPEFIREVKSENPHNQLREIPLSMGQELYDYIIVNSNWGLR